jgi:tetratricopeptide (TPR) repeat protein
MRVQLMGPDHSKTAEAAQLLGIFFMAVNENEQAIKLFEDALQVAKKNRDVPLAIRIISNYSSCLDAMGRTTEAQHLQEEAAQLQSGIGI